MKSKEEILIKNDELIKLGIINLKNIKKVFEEEKIEYWIDMGTLLGAARNGKIISWDADIDLGIFEGTLSENSVVLDKIRKLGYSVNFSKTRNKIRVKKKFPLDYFAIDIYIYKKDSDFARRHWILSTRKSKYHYLLKVFSFFQVLYSYRLFDEKLLPPCFLKPILVEQISEDNFSPSSFVTTFSLQKRNKKDKIKLIEDIITNIPHFIMVLLQRFNNKLISDVRSDLYNTAPVSVPITFFDNLGKISLHGMELSCPKDVEGYAKHRYGDDWKVPVKWFDWTYNQDDFAIDPKENE